MGAGGAKRYIEVAFDQLEIRREVAEEIVDGGRCEVPKAEDLRDFAWCQELLELEAVLVLDDYMDAVWHIPLRECPTSLSARPCLLVHQSQLTIALSGMNRSLRTSTNRDILK